MEFSVTRTDLGTRVSPIELLEALFDRHGDIMGAAQSNERAELVRFEGKFTEFMRTGEKGDGEVLLVECFGEGATLENIGIPDWKRAAVLAGCKAWSLEFTDAQDGEWNGLLTTYSFLPDSNGNLVPIVDLHNFLDVAEMLVRGWNVVQNRVGTGGTEPPFQTDVMDLVVNRLECLSEQEYAYPMWFTCRIRQILSGYEPHKLDRTHYVAEEESEDEIPPLLEDAYENPPDV
jgi:hypothetical protein